MGFKIFSIVFILFALWIAGEFITGKRTDIVEFIISVSAVILLSTINLCRTAVKINEDMNEIYFYNWCRLRKKTIKGSSITEISVGRSNGVDWVVYVHTGKLRYRIYESAGHDKHMVVSEIVAIYEKISALTGLTVQYYEETAVY